MEARIVESDEPDDQLRADLTELLRPACDAIADTADEDYAYVLLDAVADALLMSAVSREIGWLYRTLIEVALAKGARRTSEALAVLTDKLRNHDRTTAVNGRHNFMNCLSCMDLLVQHGADFNGRDADFVASLLCGPNAYDAHEDCVQDPVTLECLRNAVSLNANANHTGCYAQGTRARLPQKRNRDGRTTTFDPLDRSPDFEEQDVSTLVSRVMEGIRRLKRGT